MTINVRNNLIEYYDSIIKECNKIIRKLNNNTINFDEIDFDDTNITIDDSMGEIEQIIDDVK